MGVFGLFLGYFGQVLFQSNLIIKFKQNYFTSVKNAVEFKYLIRIEIKLFIKKL